MKTDKTIFNKRNSIELIDTFDFKKTKIWCERNFSTRLATAFFNNDINMLATIRTFNLYSVPFSPSLANKFSRQKVSSSRANTVCTNSNSIIVKAGAGIYFSPSSNRTKNFLFTRLVVNLILGNTTTVVSYGNGIVHLDRDINFICILEVRSNGFVDRVIENFIDHFG